MPEWFEDKQFWIDFSPVMFTAERISTAAEEVETLLRLAGVQEGPVLDLGCGPGRHAVAFAARGCPVTGVDLSAHLLAQARRRANEAGLRVEFVHEDMRAFVRPNAYRLATSLLSSFGYFETREDDLRVLRNVHRSLEKGGVFVIDLIGKEVLARQFQEAGAQAFEDGSMLFERREIVDDWSRLRTQWVLLRGETVRRHSLRLNLYSAQELKDALRHAGFGTVAAYGDLTGRPYDTNAPRLVVVATKRGAARAQGTR